jgi:exodeoxyribonuclease VII small subunit
MAKSQKTEAPASFEAALTELETLVATMESGDLSLEQSLTSYQRGAELLKYCQAQLADAQERVRILEAGELKPFVENQDRS